MVSHYLKELIPCRNLYYCSNASARTDGDLEKGEFYSEYFILPFLKTEPVVFLIRVPFYQFYDNIHLFLLPYSGNTEQVFHIYDAEPPYLHVVFYDIRCYAKEGSRGHPLYYNSIVCNKPVAPRYEVQCAFALTNTAFAKNQYPHAKDINQNPVRGYHRRQSFFKILGKSFYEQRCGEMRAKERYFLLLCKTG